MRDPFQLHHLLLDPGFLVHPRPFRRTIERITSVPSSVRSIYRIGVRMGRVRSPRGGRSDPRSVSTSASRWQQRGVGRTSGSSMEGPTRGRDPIARLGMVGRSIISFRTRSEREAGEKERKEGTNGEVFSHPGWPSVAPVEPPIFRAGSLACPTGNDGCSISWLRSNTPTALDLGSDSLLVV